MVSVHPFPAFLPRPDIAARMVAPPYDSMTPNERQRVRSSHPLNFLNLVRSEIDDPRLDEESRRALLADVRTRLLGKIDEGALVAHHRPAFFVVAIEEAGHTQVGLAMEVDLSSEIRRHETTRRGQEDRLLEFLEVVQASILPIFLIRGASQTIDSCVTQTMQNEPLLSFTAMDAANQRVWAVDDPAAVEELEKAFAALPALYVADGHHRLAAASRHAIDHPPGRVVAVAFPESELAVHGYHRMIEGMNGHTDESLRMEVSHRFPVQQVTEPRPRPGTTSVRLGGEWHDIDLTPEGTDRSVVENMDASVLHDRIIGPLLGVADPRTDARISFWPGTTPLSTLVDLADRPSRVTFLLSPPSIADLMAVSDAGGVMPPKSTWFSPKLRTGLIVRLLDSAAIPT